MIKCIILDFDGTIADSFDLIIETWNEVFSSTHYGKLTSENIDFLKKKGVRALIENIGLPENEVEIYLGIIKSRLSANLEKIKVFGPIKTWLTHLKHQEIKIGILTNNNYENVNTVLTKNNSNVFEFIECVTDLFGKEKKLKELSENFNIPPQEIIYIGDEIRDIEAAKSAGLKSAAVTWGFTEKKALQKAKPDYLIDGLEDLHKIL